MIQKFTCSVFLSQNKIQAPVTCMTSTFFDERNKMFRGLTGDILIKSVIIPYRHSVIILLPSAVRWSWKFSFSTVAVYGDNGLTHTHKVRNRPYVSCLFTL